MIPAASATLLTNLIASLANSNHRWVVASVDQQSWLDTIPPTGVSSLSFPNYQEVSTGPLVLNPTGGSSAANLTGGSVVTVVETRIKLVGTKVRLTVGSQRMLELEYTSRWHSGVFSSGTLQFSDGTAYTSANATLDTAIRTLALALMTARTASLEATINSGSASADPIEMPTDLLAAIKASLADVTHEWFVTSTMQNTVQGVTQFTCALASRKVKAAVGGKVPAQFTYVAKLNALGTIIDAIVFTIGTAWRTFDTDLLGAVQALASAFQAVTAEDLTEGLVAGPPPPEV